MWVAEFKVWHSGSSLLEASRDLDAACAAIYLNLVHRKGKDYITKVLVAGGRQKQALVKAIIEDKRLKITQVEGSQVFYEAAANTLFHSHVFNSKVFFVKPMVIARGFEYWTVASWDKGELLALKQKIGKLGRKRATIELLGIRKAPVNLFLPALMQQLTGKQLDAFLKAVEYGYYTVPRGISLQLLAAKLGVPRTTLREHLRKAESKLLPQLAQDIRLEPATGRL